MATKPPTSQLNMPGNIPWSNNAWCVKYPTVSLSDPEQWREQKSVIWRLVDNPHQTKPHWFRPMVSSLLSFPSSLGVGSTCPRWKTPLVMLKKGTKKKLETLRKSQGGCHQWMDSTLEIESLQWDWRIFWSVHSATLTVFHRSYSCDKCLVWNYASLIYPFMKFSRMALGLFCMTFFLERNGFISSRLNYCIEPLYYSLE